MTRFGDFKELLKNPQNFLRFIFLPRKNLSVKLGIFVMYISRFKSFDFVTWVWWNGSSINNVTIFKGGRGSNIDKKMMINCGKKEVTWGGSALCFWVVKKSVKTGYREERVKKANKNWGRNLWTAPKTLFQASSDTFGDWKELLKIPERCVNQTTSRLRKVNEWWVAEWEE